MTPENSVKMTLKKELRIFGSLDLARRPTNKMQ